MDGDEDRMGRRAGYPVEDLRAFLDVARDRIDGLLTELAEARAVASSVPSGDEEASVRSDIAQTWADARREAERIRDEADREAEALLDHARRTAEAIRVPSPSPADAPVAEP